MIEVNTVELKTHLGKYLRKVREGETIRVTSHGHPIASVVQYNSVGNSVPIKPTRSMVDLRELRGIKRRRAINGLQVLLNDRSRR